MLDNGFLLHVPVPVRTYRKHTLSAYARALDPKAAARVSLRLEAYGGGPRNRHRIETRATLHGTSLSRT